MMIECTPVCTSRRQLLAQLKGCGVFNPGKILVGFREITEVELRYVEYAILEYKLYFTDNVLRRLRGKTDQTGRIKVLENGSTGAVSFLETEPETEEKEIGRKQLQPSMYGPEQAEKEIRFLCSKIARKMEGGRICRMELTGRKNIYRPFWVVYYGGARADHKRLCRTFAADGYTVKG